MPGAHHINSLTKGNLEEPFLLYIKEHSPLQEASDSKPLQNPHRDFRPCIGYFFLKRVYKKQQTSNISWNSEPGQCFSVSLSRALWRKTQLVLGEKRVLCEPCLLTAFQQVPGIGNTDFIYCSEENVCVCPGAHRLKNVLIPSSFGREK